MNKIERIKYQYNVYRLRGIITQYGPTIHMLKQNKLGKKTLIWAFPEDVIENRSKSNQELKKMLADKYSSYSRVYLWLSRLNSDPSRFDYKAPEVFVKSLRKYLDSRPNSNIRVVMGAHGLNVYDIRYLVRELKLEKHIDWINHQQYYDLLAYISIPNAVVFDELATWTDEVSGIARESISVGGIVVKSIDKENVKSLFGAKPPILHANSVEGCTKRMMELENDKFYREIKEQSLNWATNNLHYTNQIPKLLKGISDTLHIDI